MKDDQLGKSEKPKYVPCSVCGKPVMPDYAFILAAKKVKHFDCDDPSGYRSVRVPKEIPNLKSSKF